LSIGLHDNFSSDNEVSGLHTLVYCIRWEELESLLKDKNNSVDQIRKLLLEYNDVGDDKLSLDTLQDI